MKAFIEYLIKHIVDKPDEVQVNEITGERTVVFELRVGDGDMGKVIGRSGQTARSLRTLLAAVAAKQGRRSVLEILESNGMERHSSRHETPATEATAVKPASESQSNNETPWQENGKNQPGFSS